MAFINMNSALQSSVAFLQIQKNANFKRSASNTSEDVFRIFRQTGRRIALIKQQVEKERCSYLKDSYTEKNQLYKELAGIFHSKRVVSEKIRQGGDSLSSVSLPVLSTRVSPAVEGTHNEHERHLSGHKAVKELRSINVNILKRCECCRRKAFRTIDDDDEDDAVFDDEAFHCEGQTLDENTPDKGKTKVAKKTSQSSMTSGSKKTHKEKARLVQFSRYDEVRIPASQRVQAGICALKKQSNGRKQLKQKKSVTFQESGSSTSLNNAEEKNLSTFEEKVTSVTPGLSTASKRPTLKSRASIRLETQASKNNERIHLEGNAWTSHLENVQERKLNNANKIFGISKAHCAFKKLLRQMEDEHDFEQFAQDEELRTESRAELPGSRPASNISETDSRWRPLRRSSDTLSIRLNSWTAGSLEPACMESFKENGEEEERVNVETDNEEFTLEQCS